MEVFGVVLEVACVGALAAGLGVAAASDLASRIVPNGCVLAVAASGALRAAARGELVASCAGALAVLAVMLVAAAVTTCVRGESGVGGGDVKLLAAAGMWTGAALGLAVVGASCLLVVVSWAVVALRARVSGRPLPPATAPMAPAVAVAALTAVLFRPLLAP
ncbi:A24 family peptidase [Olsenella sp. An293]|uniref:prepilin peptidase n=1 Tax=Olsenella sp. An293 TaxID=1965626 RepID=UPI000B3723C4|nr:A24 family peptidase [Olsenella sp. An293]OUO32084.1 hypothetical protein B5F85_08035 [Olsenella sp. An293]